MTTCWTTCRTIFRCRNLEELDDGPKEELPEQQHEEEDSLSTIFRKKILQSLTTLFDISKAFQGSLEVSLYAKKFVAKHSVDGK